MSRFFAAGSSSDDESGSSSDDDKVKVPSKFAKEESSSEDEEVVENVKRVAKSARDRRYEEFDSILNKIVTIIKSNDWTSLVDGEHHLFIFI